MNKLEELKERFPLYHDIFQLVGSHEAAAILYLTEVLYHLADTPAEPIRVRVMPADSIPTVIKENCYKKETYDPNAAMRESDR